MNGLSHRFVTAGPTVVVVNIVVLSIFKRVVLWNQSLCDITVVDIVLLLRIAVKAFVSSNVGTLNGLWCAAVYCVPGLVDETGMLLAPVIVVRVAFTALSMAWTAPGTPHASSPSSVDLSICFDIMAVRASVTDVMLVAPHASSSSGVDLSVCFDIMAVKASVADVMLVVIIAGVFGEATAANVVVLVIAVSVIVVFPAIVVVLFDVGAVPVKGVVAILVVVNGIVEVLVVSHGLNHVVVVVVCGLFSSRKISSEASDRA